jgi:hypothetical protein
MTKTQDRQPFQRRALRPFGVTAEIITWGPPAWPCRGRAINVRGLSWEVEICDGKLATAKFGWRLPRSIWHVDLVPRLHLDVCWDHSERPKAVRKRSERGPAAGKVKTAYDRMFDAKMQDPEWAAGYEQARARLDQSRTDVVSDEVSEPPKPARRIHRWEDIRREPRPR